MIESEFILKENLDDFKAKLAKMELETVNKDYYWRLAFWKKAGIQVPQVLEYENSFKALDSGYLSHKWHSYPAKFYPQFVRALMNICRVEKSYVVYDPYAGCGTSAVEAKILGMKYFGVDISKLAVMISKTKTDLDLDITKVRKEYSNISKKFRSMMNMDWAYTDFEMKWYNSYNRPQVKLLHHLVGDIQDERVNRFLLVALSSILRRVANTKSGQIETRFEEREGRVDILRLMTRRVDSMLEDIEQYQKQKHKKSRIVIEEGNANSYLPDEQVDFVITSPPYGNGLDYSKIHPLSIALLFGEGEVNRFKVEQSGTLNKIPRKIMDTTFTTMGTEIVSKLERNHITKAKAMSKYYVDMHNSIQNMYEALRADRNAVIIVGPTKVNDLLIPNDEVIIEIGRNVGFQLERTIGWNYDKTRRSGLEHKIKGETIVIFKKAY